MVEAGVPVILTVLPLVVFCYALRFYVVFHVLSALHVLRGILSYGYQFNLINVIRDFPELASLRLSKG